jgi:hypothetical protein
VSRLDRRLVAVLAFALVVAIVSLAGCGGGSSSTSELGAMEKSLDESSASYAKTLAILDVAEGELAAAKREFEKACPGSSTAELIGKAAEIAATENEVDFDTYKEEAEGIC